MGLLFKMQREKFDPIIQADVRNYLESGGAQFGNCAILGSTGTLGSYLLDFISLVNLMHGSNAVTYGFSRTTNSHITQLATRPGVKLAEMTELSEILNLRDVHAIHAASPASASKVLADINNLIDANINLTTKVQSCLEKIGGHFTFFSSGEIYGNSPNYPTKENDYSPFDHLTPRGYYPEVKKYTEMQLQLWSAKTKVPVSILRVFHTFGPGIHHKDTRIFASAIHDLVNNRNINLTSDGLARRSFLYTSDLALAVQRTSLEPNFQVYNVSGAEEISIVDFANLVAMNSATCQVVFSTSSLIDQQNRSPIMRGFADTTHLQNLGWIQRVKISDAIKKTIESVKWRQANH